MACRLLRHRLVRCLSCSATGSLVVCWTMASRSRWRTESGGSPDLPCSGRYGSPCQCACARGVLRRKDGNPLLSCVCGQHGCRGQRQASEQAGQYPDQCRRVLRRAAGTAGCRDRARTAAPCWPSGSTLLLIVMTLLSVPSSAAGHRHDQAYAGVGRPDYLSDPADQIWAGAQRPVQQYPAAQYPHHLYRDIRSICGLARQRGQSTVWMCSSRPWCSSISPCSLSIRCRVCVPL